MLTCSWTPPGTPLTTTPIASVGDRLGRRTVPMPAASLRLLRSGIEEHLVVLVAAMIVATIGTRVRWPSILLNSNFALVTLNALPPAAAVAVEFVRPFPLTDVVFMDSLLGLDQPQVARPVGQGHRSTSSALVGSGLGEMTLPVEAGPAAPVHHRSSPWWRVESWRFRRCEPFWSGLR
jgi:hypothetical protein